MALWHKLSETSANPRALAIGASAPTPASGGGGGYRGIGSGNASSSSSSQYRNVVAIGAASNSAARLAAAAGGNADSRGDLADGGAALERDLERMGVPAAGGGGASYAAFGRQMWEFKTINKDYALSPTYPRVGGCERAENTCRQR